MTACRTVEEVRAAALADAEDDAPLTQEQADRVAVILTPHRSQEQAA